MIAVSIIIPSFNRNVMLQRAIRSVLIQKGVPFELIVIDDGSNDGTDRMIEDFFPQVTYAYQTRQGPAAARNHGIERAHGEWIAFLDSDDEWLEGKLEAQLCFLNQNPRYRICQTEEIWIRNGKRVNPMKKHKKVGGMIYEQCLPLCLISPSAVMIHRELFDEVGVFDESLPACEDYDLWMCIARKFSVGLIERCYV
ncbi:MAG: glycosyltransferase family 2 protein, partial [Candidatus Omnitrophica bacterium]|nr:glycosyltransferase family 2 protein [Candidatus Omnitrophota bacterium]